MNEIDDLETRLQLATEVQVFDVGIECFRLLRDRERLANYINQIPAKRHPHFRPKIEALLKNSVSAHRDCVVAYYRGRDFSLANISLKLLLLPLLSYSKSNGNEDGLYVQCHVFSSFVLIN